VEGALLFVPPQLANAVGKDYSRCDSTKALGLWLAAATQQNSRISWLDRARIWQKKEDTSSYKIKRGFARSDIDPLRAFVFILVSGGGGRAFSGTTGCGSGGILCFTLTTTPSSASRTSCRVNTPTEIDAPN
jgi:hypothetical protein